MLRNYITTSIRNIFRNKLTTIVNVLGLGISVTVFSLITLYILNENNVDKSIPNADKIYRTEIGEWSLMPPGLYRTMKQVCPDVESVIIVGQYDISNALLKVDNKFFRAKKMYSVSPNIFKEFGLNVVSGNADKLLVDPFSLVLTESYAKTLFGDTNPIGKTIKASEQIQFHVTGIIEDTKNLHIEFDALYSVEDLPKILSWPTLFDIISGQSNYSCYIRLNSDLNKQKVAAQFDKYVKEQMMKENTFNSYLRPLKDVYFKGSEVKFEGDIKHGNLVFLRIMMLVAILILATACINYINLNTAVASKRAKEIGVRKVTGASRPKLITQLLGESVFVSMIAFLVGIASTELALPLFNSLIERDLIFNPFSNVTIIGVYIIGIVLIGVISGIYPAIMISSFEPIQIMKSSFTKSRNSVIVRKSLTVFQFAISVGLITTTTIIFYQLKFFRSKDLGFAKEQILYTTMPREISRNYNSFKDKVQSIPSIKSISRSNQVPGNLSWQESFKKNSQSVNFTYIPIDPDYVTTMGLTIVKGRDLDWKFPADSVDGYLINETLAKMIEMENPIGYDLPNDYGSKRMVIGVIKDFNYNSLHNPIGPLALNYRGKHYNTLNVRFTTDNIGETIKDLKNVWEEFVSDAPFEYHFLNESFDQQYRSEIKMGNIFGFFALIAILIGCMGLFGLATFTMNTRLKEIGIRKVLGATSSTIVSILSWEYVTLVVISNIIAFPVVWIMMSRWLNTFAYRIPMSISFFVLAALVSFGITYFTVLYNSIKAANTNPINTIKYE